MNTKMLLVIADTDALNQPAVTTAFQGYEYREWINGAWLVKTDLLPRDFQAKIGSAFGSTGMVILQVDRSALQNAVLPSELISYAGITRAA